jgi:hypothetical protein
MVAVTQIQVDKNLGRNCRGWFDTTNGVATTTANETNLLVNTDDPETGHDKCQVVANGFINMGEYAGGVGQLHFYELNGAAGTLKIYAGLTQSTTGQKEITGGGLTITASVGDNYNIAVVPQFLRITITRSAGDIKVKYRLIVTKTGNL